MIQTPMRLRRGAVTFTAAALAFGPLVWSQTNPTSTTTGPTSRPARQPAAAAGPASRAACIVPIHVDARVELMCILFRLAGNREYNACKVPAYSRDVEEHFGPFKDHRAVQLARQLHETRGVSYDAPMSLAMHVTDVPSLAERVPFDLHPGDLDSRWPVDRTRQFLAAARQFVKDTGFQKFFAAHQDLYDRSVRQMRRVVDQNAHFDWFSRFFGGQDQPRLEIILGLLNGQSNYGAAVSVGGQVNVYCIAGAWFSYGSDTPRFGSETMPIVIHEFCHSYANPLIDRHLDELEAAGTKIYAGVEKRMQGQAYGNWATVMRESLVRASVIRYLADTTGSAEAMGEMLTQRLLGFAWVPELSALLLEYERQRDRYPTLESFMPRIVQFFNEYAARQQQGADACNADEPEAPAR
jgi:hypothetical protein